VSFQILSSSSQVLHGVPLYHTTLTEFYRNNARYADQLYSKACGFWNTGCKKKIL